jgi:hypothetical protein
MDRFYWAGSRLFGYLAIALLALGPLVVPAPFAFADSGGTCHGLRRFRG